MIFQIDGDFGLQKFFQNIEQFGISPIVASLPNLTSYKKNSRRADNLIF